MRAIGAFLLYGLAVLLRVLAWPFLLLGDAALVIAGPLIWLRDRCLEQAREWNPRLWQRGQHTDLHPPPRA